MVAKHFPVHHNEKPIKIGKFEFANPLNVPIERRLQTFAVLFYVAMFLLGPILFVYYPLKIFFTSSYWWIIALYGVWYWYDRHSPAHGGHVWSWYKQGRLFRWLKDYFPITLHKTVDLDPGRNYIFGYHPHGITAVGAFVNFATDATGFTEIFKGIKSHLVVLAGQFTMPFRRELLMFTDTHSASKESISNLLTTDGTGHAVVIVLGGAAEAIDANAGVFDLTLKKRKGFVKLAMKLGADLVPVFSFGENDIFYQIQSGKDSIWRRIQYFIKSYAGIPPLIFQGRGIFNYSFGLLPYRHPIDVVVGAPIRVEQNEHPTPDQIADLHQKYIDGLKALFDENKVRFGVDENAQLNIAY